MLLFYLSIVPSYRYTLSPWACCYREEMDRRTEGQIVCDTLTVWCCSSLRALLTSNTHIIICTLKTYIEIRQSNNSCNTSWMMYSVIGAGPSGSRWKMKTAALQHFLHAIDTVCVLCDQWLSVQVSAVLVSLGSMQYTLQWCWHHMCDLHFFWWQSDWSTPAVPMTIHKVSEQLHCSQL